jgi:hypothetical protein
LRRDIQQGRYVACRHDRSGVVDGEPILAEQKGRPPERGTQFLPREHSGTVSGNRHHSTAQLLFAVRTTSVAVIAFVAVHKGTQRMQKPNPSDLADDARQHLGRGPTAGTVQHDRACPGGAMAGDVFGCLAYGIIPHGQNHDVGALLGRPLGE